MTTSVLRHGAGFPDQLALPLHGPGHIELQAVCRQVVMGDVASFQRSVPAIQVHAHRGQGNFPLRIKGVGLDIANQPIQQAGSFRMAREQVQPEGHQDPSLLDPCLSGVEKITVQTFADDKHVVRAEARQAWQFLTRFQDAKGQRRQISFVWEIAQGGVPGECRPHLLSHRPPAQADVGFSRRPVDEQDTFAGCQGGFDIG